MHLKRNDVTLIKVGKSNRGKTVYRYCQYRDPATGKVVRRSTHQTTDRDAWDWVEANILDQSLTTESRMRLGDYLPKALEAHFRESEATRGRPVSAVHRKNQGSYLERFILKNGIKEVVLGELRRGHLEDYRLRLVSQLGERRETVNRVLKLFKMLMKRAEEVISSHN